MRYCISLHRLLMLVTIVCMTAPASAQRPPEPLADLEFSNDKFIFKGTLVGISFWTHPSVESPKLTLHFVNEMSLAMLLPDSGDLRLQSVSTDISVDPRDLRGVDYADAVNAVLPQPLALGETVFVIAHWPGARGLELVEVRPTDDETEARLREQFREYLLQMRMFHAGVHIRATLMKIRSQIAHIDDLRKSIAAAPGTEEHTLPHLHEMIEGHHTLSDYILDRIETQMRELQSEYGSYPEIDEYDLERSYLSRTIEYLREVRSYAKSLKDSIRRDE